MLPPPCATVTNSCADGESRFRSQAMRMCGSLTPLAQSSSFWCRGRSWRGEPPGRMRSKTAANTHSAGKIATNNTAEKELVMLLFPLQTPTVRGRWDLTRSRRGSIVGDGRARKCGGGVGFGRRS